MRNNECQSLCLQSETSSEPVYMDYKLQRETSTLTYGEYMSDG